MLPQQQQSSIKAATAPGAAPSSSSSSSFSEAHRRNLAALGGSVPFSLTIFWVIIAICGSILQLAGLAALQSYSYRYGVQEFELGANYPHLSPGNVLRWDFWIWAFAAVALCAMPVLALASGAVTRARGALLSWASIATTLSIFSADRQYNISSNSTGFYYSSARTSFTGFLLAAAAGLALAYHLGVRPMAREDE